MTKKSETNINEIRPIVEKTVGNLANNIGRYGIENEDVVQDVMIKCYRYWDSFRGDCKVESWIYSITKNILINYDIKKNRKIRKANQEIYIDHDNVEFEQEDSDLESLFIEDERVQQMMEVIDNVPDELDKRILQMMLQGEETGRIAKKLKVGTGRVEAAIQGVEGVLGGDGS